MQIRKSNVRTTAVSPDGSLVAILRPSSLEIHCAIKAKAVQSYALPRDFYTQCRHMTWFAEGASFRQDHNTQDDSTLAEDSLRLLLADDDNAYVYNPHLTTREATINCACSSAGKISHIRFGHSPEEVLAISEFGIKAVLWSIVTGQGIEIRDVKLCNSSSYSFRPKTGHLAILTRPAAQDVLTILKPNPPDVLATFETDTTDAQEISWSDDDLWLVIRDSPVVGDRVLFYTPEGQLFKIWAGPQQNHPAMGVKSIQWNHADRMIAIGDYNDGLTFLGQEDLRSLAFISHKHWSRASIRSVWIEQLEEQGTRSYAAANQPTKPPTSTEFAKTAPPKHGISVTRFAVDGAMLATKCDSFPTTVWIWCLRSGVLISMLVHHNPVKDLQWHPTCPDLLLIHCALDAPVVHIWKSSWSSPTAFKVTFDRVSGDSITQTAWLAARPNLFSKNIARLVVSQGDKYSTIDVDMAEGGIIPGLDESSTFLPEAENDAVTFGSRAEDMFDEGNSLDLSPIKLSSSTFGSGNLFRTTQTGPQDIAQTAQEDSLDDTFQIHKRQPRTELKSTTAYG